MPHVYGISDSIESSASNLGFSLLSSCSEDYLSNNVLGLHLIGNIIIDFLNNTL